MITRLAALRNALAHGMVIVFAGVDVNGQVHQIDALVGFTALGESDQDIQTAQGSQQRGQFAGHFDPGARDDQGVACHAAVGTSRGTGRVFT